MAAGSLSKPIAGGKATGDDCFRGARGITLLAEFRNAAFEGLPFLPGGSASKRAFCAKKN